MHHQNKSRGHLEYYVLASVFEGAIFVTHRAEGREYLIQDVCKDGCIDDNL